MKIGVLAIQGDFELHQRVLAKMGVKSVLVRDVKDLSQCDGLIIPGGESTTFLKILKANNLFNQIKKFGRQKAIMGTCAGSITLAKNVVNFPMKTLDLIDMKIARNAYGRQIDSFIDTVELNLNNEKLIFEGVFIRAPKILEADKSVKKLGYYNSDVVLAENDHILVTTFHPELTDDFRIHQYFLDKIKNMKS
jgi:5'-phosphate synthase pdxT subunit